MFIESCTACQFLYFRASPTCGLEMILEFDRAAKDILLIKANCGQHLQVFSAKFPSQDLICLQAAAAGFVISR